MPDNEVTRQVGMSREGVESIADAQAKLANGVNKLSSGIARIESEAKLIREANKEQLDTLVNIARAQEMGGVSVGSNGQLGNTSAILDKIDTAITDGFNALIASDEDRKLYEAFNGDQVADIIKKLDNNDAAVHEIKMKLDAAQKIREQRVKLHERELEAQEQMRELQEKQVELTKEEIDANRQARADAIAKNASETLGDFGSMLNGDIQERLRGAGGLFSRLGSALGETRAGSLVSSLGSGAGSLASSLAAPLALIAGYRMLASSMQGANDAAQRYGTNDLTLGARFDAMSQLTGWATGLKQEEIRSAIDSLALNYNVNPNSKDFGDGIGFAVGARQKYGIGVEDSTKMFANVVLKAGRSVDELNETMGLLDKTAKESNMQMSDLMGVYNQTSASLKGLTGSEATADAITGDLMKHMDPLTMQMLSSSASEITDRDKFNKLLVKFQREGYGDDSYILAQQEYLSQSDNKTIATRMASTYQNMLNAGYDNDNGEGAFARMYLEGGYLDDESKIVDAQNYLQGLWESDPEGFRALFGLGENEVFSQSDMYDPQKLASYLAKAQIAQMRGVAKSVSANEIQRNAASLAGKYAIEYVIPFSGQEGYDGTWTQTQDLVSALNNGGVNIDMTNAKNANAFAGYLGDIGFNLENMSDERRREFAADVYKRYLEDDSGADLVTWLGNNAGELADAAGAGFNSEQGREITFIVESKEDWFKTMYRKERDDELRELGRN